MVNTLEHAVKKVCNVFGLDTLNKLQEDSVKYIFQKKKEIFVNLLTGLEIAHLPGPAVGILVLAVI